MELELLGREAHHRIKEKREKTMGKGNHSHFAHPHGCQRFYLTENTTKKLIFVNKGYVLVEAIFLLVKLNTNKQISTAKLLVKILMVKVLPIDIIIYCY